MDYINEELMQIFQNLNFIINTKNYLFIFLEQKDHFL